MNITIITDNYNDTLSTRINCTNNEFDIDLTMLVLLLTIPFGLSFLFLMSLMAYTLVKRLFNNK